MLMEDERSWWWMTARWPGWKQETGQQPRGQPRRNAVKGKSFLCLLRREGGGKGREGGSGTKEQQGPLVNTDDGGGGVAEPPLFYLPICALIYSAREKDRQTDRQKERKRKRKERTPFSAKQPNSNQTATKQAASQGMARREVWGWQKNKAK